MPLLFYCGSGGASKYDQIALEESWNLGIRSCGKYRPSSVPIKFVDNKWTDYDHSRHLDLVRHLRPCLATARDIEQIKDLPKILQEAGEIARYCDKVVLIPKVEFEIPDLDFPWMWGYSVPSGYGKCDLPLSFFGDRPCHLLGGSPHKQSEFLGKLNIFSLDCNYFMISAKFGKSTWPDAKPRNQKLTKGCYNSFRVSLQKTKQFWEENGSRI